MHRQVLPCMQHIVLSTAQHLPNLVFVVCFEKVPHQCLCQAKLLHSIRRGRPSDPRVVKTHQGKGGRIEPNTWSHCGVCGHGLMESLCDCDTLDELAASMVLAKLDIGGSVRSRILLSITIKRGGMGYFTRASQQKCFLLVIAIVARGMSP